MPKFICEQCFTSLLNAESIIDICRKNDAFLNELASVEEEVLVEVVVNEDEELVKESLEDPVNNFHVILAFKRKFWKIHS